MTESPMTMDGGTSATSYSSTIFNLGTSRGDVPAVPYESMTPFLDAGTSATLYSNAPLMDAGSATNSIYYPTYTRLQGGGASNSYVMGPILECGTALPTPATTNPITLDGGNSVAGYPSSVINLGSSKGDVAPAPYSAGNPYFDAGGATTQYEQLPLIDGGGSYNSMYYPTFVQLNGGGAGNTLVSGPAIELGSADPASLAANGISYNGGGATTTYVNGPSLNNGSAT
jgi:hypothetical protein